MGGAGGYKVGIVGTTVRDKLNYHGQIWMEIMNGYVKMLAKNNQEEYTKYIFFLIY